jgi:hypothetical protein
MMTLSNSLADIAEQVKTFVIAADASQRAAIDGMLSAGRLLNEAKDKCAHGEWAGFLDRAGIHERTARRYMQLARSGLKSDTVAEMGGLKAALEHLAKVELFRCKLPSGNDTLLATLPEDRSPLALVWADEARPEYFLAASIDLQSNTVACTRAPVKAERVTLANGSFDNALWETLDQLLERRAGDAEFQIVPDMVGLRDTLIDHAGGVVI